MLSSTAIQQGETATAKVLIGTYASTLPGLKIDNAQVVNGQGIINLGGALENILLVVIYLS